MFTSGSPGSGNLSIGIALVLEDRFSNQAREASAEIRRLHNDAKQIVNANLSAAQRVAGIGLAAGTGLLYGLKSATLSGADFIDTMTFVSAISKNTGVSFDQLSTKAKNLGRDTRFTSLEIASAMQFLALAGQSTSEIYANIGAAANLANATVTEISGKGGAADILTNIMRMFSIDASESNSERISDVLTRAVTRSNTNLVDLGEAIRYAGTTASNLGVTVEQTAAAIGVLGNAGLQGSMAGTALGNAYRYLAKSLGDPNFKGGKALASIGLSKEDFTDAQGNLIDLGLGLQKIVRASGTLSDLDRYNLLVSIFGVRGERAATSLIRAFETYETLLHDINNSEGAAAEVQAKRIANLKGQINVLTSSWENLQVSFTQALEPTLLPILRTFSAAIQAIQRLFDVPFLGQFLSTFIGLSAIFITIRSGAILLRASWKLLFNDSTVSIKNMMLILNGGWKEAQIEAQKYAAIERGIIAQRKAGFSTQAGRRAYWKAYGKPPVSKKVTPPTSPPVQPIIQPVKATKPPVIIAGGKTKEDALRNKQITSLLKQKQVEVNSTKSTISTPTIIASQQQRPKQQLQQPKTFLRTDSGFRPSNAGPIVLGQVGKQAAKSAASSAARFATLRGIGTALGTVARFVTGPWGFAIITIASLIPSLISVFKKNSDSTDELTAEQKRQTAEQKRLRDLEEKGIGTAERTALVTRELALLKNYLEVIAKNTSKDNPVVVRVETPMAMDTRNSSAYSPDRDLENTGN